MRDRFDWFARYGDLLAHDPPSAVTVPGPEFPRLDTTRLNKVVSQARAFYGLAYNREDSDCGVRALAVACAAPYEAAHQALTHEGRMPGTPVSPWMLRLAAHHLGCALVPEYDPLFFGPTIRQCTHAMRDLSGGYILVTCDHAAGVWNGEVIDWSRDRDFKITAIYRVKKVK